MKIALTFFWGKVLLYNPSTFGKISSLSISATFRGIPISMIIQEKSYANHKATLIILLSN